MRIILTILLFCFTTLDFFSQSESHTDEQIYLRVDEPAEFPGGSNEMFLFLAKNMQYPAVAIENGIEGRVYVKFVVNKSGTVSDVAIERGIPNCPECAEESLRIVRAMPAWKPAKISGQPVNYLLYLPIKFQLK